ncbi:MAG: shikimate dehydrogenase, partial [Betaproteobacteria bacterium]|nr:shikimate dehydrogenase [Betaproteobacteria bacterium]
LARPMKHFAVIGHPVQHSRSPAIHQAFARQFGHRIRYERLHAAPGSLIDVLEAFRAGGGDGVNITLPFKLEAYELCHQRGPRAVAAAAVNTISFRDGLVVGENTDGLGLVDDLHQRLAFGLHGASVLMFGAGGASRGVLAPLFEAGCSRVTLVNRDLLKLSHMVEQFKMAQTTLAVQNPSHARLDHCSYAELPARASSQRWDLLINATSAGLNAQALEVPADIFAAAGLAYDMVYAAQPTAFMQQAIAAGCPQVCDGLGMLVGQAAHAYAIWQGLMPDTMPVYQELRSAIDAA